MKRTIAAIVAAGALVVGLAGTASAERQAKTQICHRTASDSNPYVLITINNSALDAHIGDEAHPPKGGREDYVATEAEIEAGFCGEQGPGTVKYRIIRRMKYLKTVFEGPAGLGVSVSCFDGNFIVQLGDSDTVVVPVGEARQDTILRVRSQGVVLVKVRESEVC